MLSGHNAISIISEMKIKEKKSFQLRWIERDFISITLIMSTTLLNLLTAHTYKNIDALNGDAIRKFDE